MKILIVPSLFFIATASQAEIFSAMVPTSISLAATNLNGHSGIMGTGFLSVSSSDPNLKVVKVNSVTIHGFRANRPGQMSINMSNPAGSLLLHDGGFGQGAVSGDITFVPGTSTNTFASRIASIGATGTITGGSFTPQGTFISIETPIVQDFRKFAGGPAGWGFNFSNSSAQFGGTFTGISVNVELAPVPEPASIFALGSGLLLMLRRKR